MATNMRTCPACGRSYEVPAGPLTVPPRCPCGAAAPPTVPDIPYAVLVGPPPRRRGSAPDARLIFLVAALAVIAVGGAAWTLRRHAPGLGAPAWNPQAAREASQRGDNDEVIRLCSQAIDSGRLAHRDLAIAYNDRGLAHREKGD